MESGGAREHGGLEICGTSLQEAAGHSGELCLSVCVCVCVCDITPELSLSNSQYINCVPALEY